MRITQNSFYQYKYAGDLRLPMGAVVESTILDLPDALH